MSVLDNYDEEFNSYLNLSKTLISKLKNKEDRAICTKWIRKLISLKTKDVSVKRNRNAFFRYLLNVLQEGTIEETGCPYYDDLFNKPGLDRDDKPAYMSKWSADKRTYIAAKPIPGHGALIYMAVAKDPSLGWDYPSKRKK